MCNTLRAFHTRLATPIDIASLVFFRIGFGAIMLWEAWRFLTGGKVDPRRWSQAPLVARLAQLGKICIYIPAQLS